MSNQFQNREVFSLKQAIAKHKQSQQTAGSKLERSTAYFDKKRDVASYASRPAVKKMLEYSEIFKRNKLNAVNLVTKEYTDKGIKDLIPATGNWHWDQRFAVAFSKPEGINYSEPALGVVKTYTENFLSPYRLQATSLGYAKEYKYSPGGTKPDNLFWWYTCHYLDNAQKYENDLKKMSSLVYTPPSMLNMLTKMKTNLADTTQHKIPADSYKELDKVFYTFEEDGDSFEPLKKEGLNWASAVDVLSEWLVDTKLNSTSAAFPYNISLNGDGRPFGKFSAENIDLLGTVYDDVRKLLSAIAVAMARPQTMSLKLAAVKELYAKLKAMPPQAYSKGDHKAKDHSEIWPFIVWEVEAGNVKPVTAEEIKNCKPDRAIYMSSGVMRMASNRLTKAIKMNHPSCLSNFGYAKGGALRLLTELAAQHGDDIPPFTIHDDGTPRHPFSAPHSFIADPDVKSMDMHIDKEYFDVDCAKQHACIQKAVGPKWGRYAPVILLLGLITFLSEMQASPLILINQGVMLIPFHLNCSGGPATYRVNQLKSIAMLYHFREALNRYLGAAYTLAHKASGDDNRFWVYLLRVITEATPNEKYWDPAGMSTADPDVARSRQELQAVWEKVLTYVEKKHFVSFKKETRDIHFDFSASAFLGAHISFVNMPDDEQFPIPYRPLYKSLFTALWSGRNAANAKIGLTPSFLSCCRLLSVWYETAAAFPEIEINHLFQEYYAKQYQTTTDRSRDILTYTESSFENGVHLIPHDQLPDSLPTRQDICEWITGIEYDSPSPHGPDFTRDSSSADWSDELKLPVGVFTDGSASITDSDEALVQESVVETDGLADLSVALDEIMQLPDDSHEEIVEEEQALPTFPDKPAVTLEDFPVDKFGSLPPVEPPVTLVKSAPREEPKVSPPSATVEARPPKNKAPKHKMVIIDEKAPLPTEKKDLRAQPLSTPLQNLSQADLATLFAYLTVNPRGSANWVVDGKPVKRQGYYDVSSEQVLQMINKLAPKKPAVEVRLAKEFLGNEDPAIHVPQKSSGNARLMTNVASRNKKPSAGSLASDAFAWKDKS
jgi:hypothetical protein